MNLPNIKYLYKLEITLLSLFLIFLPGFEAPKNILLAMYAIVAAYRLISHPPAQLSWTSWDWVFSILLISILAAGWGSPIQSYAFHVALGEPLSCLAFCWLLSKSGYTSQQSLRLVFIALFAMALTLTYSFYDKFSALEIRALELNSVGHVNHSSIYLCIGLAFCLALVPYFKNKNNSMYLVALLLAVYLFAGIIISDSRGTVGIAFVLIFFSLFFFKQTAPKMLGAMSIVIILVSLIVLQPSVVKKQIENQNNHIILSFRDRVWNLSLEIAKINPLFGVGRSQFNKIKPEDVKVRLEDRQQSYDENKYFFTSHGHSLFFNTLAERGIFGVIALGLFLFKWLWDSLYRIKQERGSITSLSYTNTMSFLTWVVVVGVGLVNTTLHHEHGMLSLLALGLLINCLQQRTSEL